MPPNTPSCHSERSEESSRSFDANKRSEDPIGFFASLRMTNWFENAL
jgi:hypothetical protein